MSRKNSGKSIRYLNIKLDGVIRTEMEAVIVATAPKYRSITQFVEVAIQRVCDEERRVFQPRPIIMGESRRIVSIIFCKIGKS